MDTFLRQAEDILDVAAGGGSSSQDVVILIDRQGGMRMLDPAGWSIAGLRAEFGATALYKVEQRSEAVRVEGWQGGQRCLLQRNRGPLRLSDLPGVNGASYPTMLQVASPELACSNERSPQVRNS